MKQSQIKHKDKTHRDKAHRNLTLAVPRMRGITKGEVAKGDYFIPNARFWHSFEAKTNKQHIEDRERCWMRIGLGIET